MSLAHIVSGAHFLNHEIYASAPMWISQFYYPYCMGPAKYEDSWRQNYSSGPANRAITLFWGLPKLS